MHIVPEGGTTTLCHMQNLNSAICCRTSNLYQHLPANSSISRVAHNHQSTYLSSLVISKRLLFPIKCRIHVPCSSRDLKSFIDPNPRTITVAFPFPVIVGKKASFTNGKKSTPGITKVKSYSGRFRTPDVDSKPTETHLASLTSLTSHACSPPFIYVRSLASPNHCIQPHVAGSDGILSDTRIERR